MSLTGIRNFFRRRKSSVPIESVIIDEKYEIEKKFLQAAERHSLEELTRCIDLGVDPNCREKKEKATALHIAAEKDDITLAIKLIACENFNIQPINYHGQSPLHVACEFQRLRMAKFLLKNGANPNIRNHMKKTPLHIAVHNNSIAMTQLLLKYEANPNVIDCMQNTPLHIAVLEQNFFPMVRLLILKGADVNIDVGNMSIFLEAVLSCHTMLEVEIILFLVHKNADCFMVDKVARRNALHFVAISGYCPLGLKLLRLGINPKGTDYIGKTAIDVARTHGNIRMAFMLENYGKTADFFELNIV